MSRDENVMELNKPLEAKVGGFGYSAAAVANVVVSVIASIIISACALEYGSDGYIYVSYIAAQIGILLAVILTMRLQHAPFRKVFPVRCSPKYFIIGALIIFGLMFSLSWVNSWFISLFEGMGYVPRESTSYYPTLTGGLIVPALLVIAVLPAICEEAMFRGVLFNSLNDSVGSIPAIFIVGFCFSLFHGSPEQTVYQFIAGCLFAFIAMRSGSILPSVMMHFLNNAVIIILAACNCFDDAGELIISGTGNVILMCISAACLVAGILWLVLDRHKNRVKSATRSKSAAQFFIYAAIGIIIMLVIWLLVLFGVS
ncbi:MAG: CPBP family intramembrane metalloprotease [Clostridia bacterium]|nr:CPBP family intramembrane metalloprotease [Clostridia bacterium]